MRLHQLIGILVDLQARHGPDVQVVLQIDDQDSGRMFDAMVQAAYPDDLMADLVVIGGTGPALIEEIGIRSPAAQCECPEDVMTQLLARIRRGPR